MVSALSVGPDHFFPFTYLPPIQSVRHQTRAAERTPRRPHSALSAHCRMAASLGSYQLGFFPNSVWVVVVVVPSSTLHAALCHCLGLAGLG